MNRITNDHLPFVSVIIPCRNEEKFIGTCLESIIAQDYPKDKLEVLVVDGMSEDRTREVLEEYVKRCSFIKVLDNPRRITPAAMNIGIENARGDLIVIINSHAYIDSGFLRESVQALKRTKADAVGGTLSTINMGDGIISKAIPHALDSVFGAGGKRYRTRKEEGFVSDTLPYCLYKREVFDRIGLIDEDLVRDQDEEFNYRLLKEGGKIYYSPRIRSYLYARPSLKKLWNQHFQYGYFKPLVAKKTGLAFSWRQVIPALFVGSLAFSAILSFIFKPSIWLFGAVLSSYLFANLIFSFLISLKTGPKYLFVLPAIFAAIHFSYGTGYIKGVIDFLLMKKHRKGGIGDIGLTR